MDEVEQIKQKLDIVEVINGFLPLKKAGRNFKTNCPFHSEKTASFTVSPERQIWHCFGCSKGGDVFKFLMDFENIDFSESLKILAEKSGVKLSKPVFRNEAEKRRDAIYGMNSLAAQFYNYLLTKHPAGKNALAYLTQKRKVSLELINTFMLGFAPENGSPLTSYLLRKKKYFDQDLILAGLSIRRGGNLYDFFRGRIIFPIMDARGNVIAFSGRTLNDENGPKYVNTRETPVYIKGDSLFGINLAKDEIKKEKKAILVEGEFDVISAFKEGIKNIVAVKGTALTDNQIKLLKRYSPKISFCFDTDPAGTEAQRRSIQLIENEGVQASVIIPPLGKDPDELLNDNPLLFKKAVKNDINIYDFIIDSASSTIDKKTAEGKTLILEKTLPYLAQIENEVVKEHYFKKLASNLDSSLESVLKQAEKTKNLSKPQPKTLQKQEKSREELVEAYLLSLILQSKNVTLALETTDKIMGETEFSLPVIGKIFKLLKESNLPIDNFAKTLPSELVEFFDFCFLSPLSEFPSEEMFIHEVEKTAKTAKLLSVKKELKELEEKIRELEKEGKEKETEILRERFANLSHGLRLLD